MTSRFPLVLNTTTIQELQSGDTVDLSQGTGLPNAGLVNSSVTIGTTPVALGAAATTLGGLETVTLTQNPTQGLEAATKQYVDAFAQGVVIKAPCQVATVTDLATTTGGTVTYDNGAAGVGATLTLSVPMPVLDGYTVLNNDRVLVKNELDQAYNGIYTWATGGTVLTRATDFDTAAQIASGNFVFIENGTVNDNTGYVQTADVVDVGTDPIEFSQLSGVGTYTAGTGLSLTGTQFSIANTAVTAGSYTSANITVNAQGQITAAANGSSGGGATFNAPCQAATTTTLAVATGGTVEYDNGTAGVGATLTLSSALTVLDGYTLLVDDRVLVKNEVDQATNGIYLYQTGGLELLRVTDYETPAQIVGGNMVYIENGTVNTKTGYVQIDEVTTIGTDPIVFSQVTSSSGGVPGGANTQIQFNNGGAFAGSSELTWSGSSMGILGAQLGVKYASSDTGRNSGSTYFGKNALASQTSGFDNLAVGASVLKFNTTGFFNVAVGNYSLQANTTGVANIAVGSNVLGSLTTGSQNIALGLYAMNNVTTGEFNIAIGNSAIRRKNGQFNIGIGFEAMGGTETTDDTAQQNVAIGFYALAASTPAGAGSYNTVVGSSAMRGNNGGSGNIMIGTRDSAGTGTSVFPITTQNDRVVIGSTSVTNAYIQVAWTVVSDARDKTDFSPVAHGLDFVNQLKPTAYRYKKTREATEGHGPLRYGFKAQDVLELEGDNPVIVDADDADKLRFNDQAMIAVLVNAIQELSAKFEAYKAAHP